MSSRLQSGFERVDLDAHPQRLAAYLDLVGDLEETRTYRSRAVELLGLSAGDQVLEVGCGGGEHTLALAHAVGPTGKVVALDASETMIARARERIPADLPVELMTSDAHELRLPDAGFAACCADRVFQHLEHPAKALAEMVRVCRIGGRIVISEPDWETLTVELQDRELARRISLKLADSVRQGSIGRRLVGLFRDAGLSTVAVEGSVLAITAYDLAERLLGLASRAVRAYEEGRLTAEETAAWLAAMEHAAQADRFFCSLTGFTVRGTRGQLDV
jgi:ubiquinone/menaquinone biosynthesis C-methylase UbiE